MEVRTNPRFRMLLEFLGDCMYEAKARALRVKCLEMEEARVSLQTLKRPLIVLAIRTRSN
jgi:hypothetical protein